MTPSQHVLTALGVRLGAFHASELVTATGLTELQVQGAIRTLLRRGYAKRCGTGKTKATAAGLEFLASGACVQSGPVGPRPLETSGGSLRARIWKALRLIRKATVADLLVLALRGEETPGVYNSVKDYLNALVRSGHLARLTRNQQRDWPATRGATRYSLVKDTGLLPPQFNQRQRRVFDPNTGESFDVA